MCASQFPLPAGTPAMEGSGRKLDWKEGKIQSLSPVSLLWTVPSSSGCLASGDKPWHLALVRPLLPSILPAREKGSFLLSLSGLSHHFFSPFLFFTVSFLLLPDINFRLLKDLVRVLSFRVYPDGYNSLGVISLGPLCLNFWTCGLWRGFKKEKKPISINMDHILFRHSMPRLISIGKK